MRIKNKKMLYGSLSVFLLLSTILPCYTLLILNTTGAKAVSEDIIDFDYIESLLQYNSSEDSSEYQDVVNAINYLESNYGDILDAEDQNSLLKTSSTNLNLNLNINLGITKVEIPWWLNLLSKNPLLGLVVLMVMGLGIGMREVAKSLFAKAFPGVTEMLEALNEFVECMENLEENLGDAIDNALENVVEGFIEATIEGIDDSFNYEPPNLWEIRELVSIQLKTIDSSNDWTCIKQEFQTDYIDNSKSFRFKNLAGSLMYLYTFDYWFKNQMLPNPSYDDPSTWYCPYDLDLWSTFADFALYYHLELSCSQYKDIAYLRNIVIPDDYNLYFDFNHDSRIDYISDFLFQTTDIFSFLASSSDINILSSVTRYYKSYMNSVQIPGTRDDPFSTTWACIVNIIAQKYVEPALERQRLHDDYYKKAYDEISKALYDPTMENIEICEDICKEALKCIETTEVLGDWTDFSRCEDITELCLDCLVAISDIEDEYSDPYDPYDINRDDDNWGDGNDNNGQSTGEPDDGSSDDNGQSTGDFDDGSSDFGSDSGNYGAPY